MDTDSAGPSKTVSPVLSGSSKLSKGMYKDFFKIRNERDMEKFRCENKFLRVYIYVFLILFLFSINF